MDGEVDVDGMVSVTATVKVITGKSANDTSPDATMPAPMTIARADPNQNRETMTANTSSRTALKSGNKAQTQPWHRLCRTFLKLLYPHTEDGQEYLLVSADLCNPCL